MTIKFFRDGIEENILSEEQLRLVHAAKNLALSATLEFKNGQYWLHSNIEGENPIGIEIDKNLSRHEEYFRQSSLHKEILARALGIKGAFRPRILDLTAGLLGDSLLFLSMGCEVFATERNPLVSFLIESSLKNAQHPFLSRFKFKNSEARDILLEKPEVDVVFYDPMFEDANLKASPKKEMRIFRELISSDLDAEDVFKLALAFEAKRLVVKRPRLSKSLSNLKPQEFVGKATRYDVYFSQNHGPFGSNPLK